MLKTVNVIRDVMSGEMETHTCESILDFLPKLFPTFPEHARIYHEAISEATDVTPRTSEDVEKLASLDGKFYVVIYPAGFDPVTWIVGALVVSIVAAAFVLPKMLKTPALPTMKSARQAKSPNNELSDRVNSARPLARIPDIFGTVRSTPDLLVLPYTTYIDNTEVEHCYMCIGKGQYVIHDIRDGETPLQNIGMAWARIFGPNTSPNWHPENCIRVNDAPDDEYVFGVERCNAVNGQKIYRPAGHGGSSIVIGNENISFICTNQIQIAGDDFTKYFAAGQKISVSGSYGNINKSIDYSNMSARISKAGVGITIDLIDTTGIPQGVDKGSWITCTFNNPAASKLNGRYFVQACRVWAGSDDISGRYGTFCDIAFLDADDKRWLNVADVTGWFLADLHCDYAEVGSHISFDGVYQTQSVTSSVMYLNRPEAVNPAWQTGPDALNTSAVIFGIGSSFTEGPYILASKHVDHFIINIVSPSDYYASGPDPANNGQTMQSMPLTTQLEVKWYAVGADYEIGEELGSETVTYTGNGDGSFCGRTYVFKVAQPQQIAVSVRNLFRDYDPDDPAFQGWILSQEVKWRDLYGFEKNFEHDPGDITTVQCVTYATDGALAVKQRKLNLLVTRKIPLLENNSYNIDGELVPTRDAASIIAFVAKDPYIGGLEDRYIDFANIREEIGRVSANFGNSAMTEFCYTFDNDNISFEETLQTIANAVFCSAFRQFAKIMLRSEYASRDFSLMFNSRNKVADSERRSLTFGNQNNYDGVELTYTDPSDDSTVTYYIPEDRSARSPQKIQTVGVRNEPQAFCHAWRAWQKIQLQSLSVEFDATQEAELLVPGDRIICDDATKGGSMYDPTLWKGAEITHIEGNVVTFSQPIVQNNGNNQAGLWVQLSDGTCQCLYYNNVLGGEFRSEYRCSLRTAPRLPLIARDDNPDRYNVTLGTFASAGYLDRPGLAGGVGAPSYGDFCQELMVVEKKSNTDLTVSVKAVNYTDHYYDYDTKWTHLPLPPPIGPELAYIGGKPEDPDDPNPVYPSPQDPNVALWPFTPDPNPAIQITTTGSYVERSGSGWIIHRGKIFETGFTPNIYMEDSYVRGIDGPNPGLDFTDQNSFGETLCPLNSTSMGMLSPYRGFYVGVEFTPDWIQDWNTATQRERSIRVEVGVVAGCTLYVNGVTVRTTDYLGPQVFYGGPGAFAQSHPDGTPRCYFDSARRLLVRKGRNTVAFHVAPDNSNHKNYSYPSYYNLPNDQRGEVERLKYCGIHFRIVRDDGSEVVLYKTSAATLGQLVTGQGVATVPYLP